MVYLVRRFVAFYIDMLLIMLFVYLAYSIYFLCMGINIGDIKQPSAPLSLFMQFSATFLYFFSFEFLIERTIGKLILKFKIIGYNERMGFKRFVQAFKRNLMRLFPLDPFSIFLNEEYRPWHDLISKTRVVDTRNVIKHI